MYLNTLSYIINIVIGYRYVYVDVNELKAMLLHVVMDGIKVFHFTDEKTITHTVAFNGIYDPDFNSVGQSHCQFGTNIMCYNIKICNGSKCASRKERLYWRSGYCCKTFRKRWCKSYIYYCFGQ